MTAPVVTSFRDQNCAPYFGINGLAIALGGALVLAWPMLIAGGPLYHFDTVHYYERGAQIVSYLLSQPTGAGANGGDGGALPGDRAGAKIRSLPYSLYVYLTGATPLGLYLSCLMQGTAVIWAFLSLVPRLRPREAVALALGFAFVVLGSSLPWFVSYAMPDILGAILPIYYISLLGRIDDLRISQRWMLALLATAAIAAHYGNLPLAAALAVAVVAWRAWRKSLRPVTLAFAAGPVLVAAALNMAGGALATNEVSAAPKRLPILLARSLEDGPARWYLQEACPEAGYAMCDLFETMPDNIASFLWADEGYRGASDITVEAIRDEENAILWEAFKRYPVQQTQALLGNATRQMVMLGTDDHWPIDRGASAFDPASISAPRTDLAKPGGIILFDIIVPFATLLAAFAYALAIATGRVTGFYASAGVLLMFALIVNAGVFGGLSAPVDRYQGRLAWLVPALAPLALVCGRQLGQNARRP